MRKIQNYKYSIYLKILLFLFVISFHVFIPAGIFADVVFYLVLLLVVIFSLKLSKKELIYTSIACFTFSFMALILEYREYSYDLFYWAFVIYIVHFIKLFKK